MTESGCGSGVEEEDSAEICDERGAGIFIGHGKIPHLHRGNTNAGVMVVVYLILLLYLFMGVAIVSDVFMTAIEVITSKKIRTKDPKTGRWVNAKLWNDTVANLTLMALGSSAPEILLSVIELMSRNVFSGELGPSTIVGSAAFNLLVISAVCVCAIPSPEVRSIKYLEVYFITASFSVFAYVWLIIILLWNSPHVIDIWEGILTFLFFPLLITLAYLADKGYFSPPKRAGDDSGARKAHTLEMPELAKLEQKVRQQHAGENLTDEQVMELISKEREVPLSRAAYRVAAIRQFTGGRKIEAVLQGGGHDDVSALYNVVPAVGAHADTLSPRKGGVSSMVPTFEFKAVKYTVLENAGHLCIPVIRHGDHSTYAAVAYATREGTAKQKSDYIHVEGRLEFAAGETEKQIEIKIIDDTAYEQDEDFFVDLKELDSFSSMLGKGRTARVIIIDDDEPGVLGFDKDQFTVTEAFHDQTIMLTVERKMGGTGPISCSYFTEDDSAVKDKDYEAVNGELNFESGQMSAQIPVKIKANGRFEGSEMFSVILAEPKGGCRLDTGADGNGEKCICNVFIECDQDRSKQLSKLMTFINFDKAGMGHSNWKSQFFDALYVNGGDDDESGEPREVSALDYIMHGLTLPWKLMFSLIPPTDFCGGWVCFFSSLLAIGIVTAFIGDIASLFGCALGCPDALTAITFVALGTSLPDTFASRSAAVQDPHADASIGNVTGSNSVNVFLGLGLPWMMGAFKWSTGRNAEWEEKYVGKTHAQDWFGDLDPAHQKILSSCESTEAIFVVEAGSLAYSVIVFTCCALTAILLLYIRRHVVDGELGGPKELKYASSAFLVGLWFVYIGMSAIKVFEDRDR